MLAIGALWAAGAARPGPDAGTPELACRPGRPSERGALARASRLEALRRSLRTAPEAGSTRGVERAAPDTAKLLVILAEFVEETTDDPNTTGDGRFQLEPSTEYAINQPPHDHAYFDRQCRAVANYFDAASDHRFTLEWDLFPASGSSPAFVGMPQRMRYYNPDTTDTALNTRLAEFFRDAVTAADTRGAVFSGYDYYVVFHAGVGQDLLIDEDTPSDIVSAFLSFGELRDYLGEGATYPGIAVEGGSYFVREGLWLPETENQEGYEFAITGVFAQLMGSQLGLPILWNPDSGAPGIGRFGLMDQGGGNELGKVPAFPDGWSRFDLGWADAAIVHDGNDVGIRALGALGAGADVVIVPVDEREYFLLENRKRDINDDGRLEIVSDNTVPVEVTDDEYDFGIPGSGLLVWHVDQGVIDAKRGENRVNADFTHRGVKLVEADGLDEIGLYPEGGFGLPGDAFHTGSNTAFTPTSNPSSRSNYGGAATNVAITAVSDTGLVMRCDIASRGFVPGLPDSSGRGYVALTPGSGDIDGDGATDIVVADSTGISVWRAPVSGVAGRAFSLPYEDVRSFLVADVVPTNGKDEVIVSDVIGRIRVYGAQGDSLALLDSLLARSPGARRHPMQPLLSASNAYGGDELEVFAARNDSCYIWSWTSETSIERTSFLAPFFTTSVLFTDVLGQLEQVNVIDVDENGVFVGYDIDELLHYRDLGQLTPVSNLRVETLRRPARPPVIGDLDRDGVAEVVLLSTDGLLSVYHLTGPVSGEYDLALASGWPVHLEANESGPALGDLDGDGRPEIVVGEAENVWVFSRNGRRFEGWPVTLSPFHGGEATLPITTQPLVADVDRDGRQDVVVSAPDGVLRAYDASGAVVPGWPLVAGREHVVTPALTGFGGGSLVSLAPGGAWLYALRTPDASLDADWPTAGGSEGRASVLDPSRLDPVAPSEEFLAPESVYIYPNPATDRARVRFFLGEDATVVVSVYDASGLRVAEIETAGIGGAPNEVDWNLENDDGKRVRPGLYLVRLNARGGGNSVARDLRLAITR